MGPKSCFQFSSNFQNDKVKEMLHSVFGAHPTRFGQSWPVPGLKRDVVRLSGSTNVDPKVHRLQQRSDRKLMALQGQQVPASSAQQADANRKQLMTALGKLLNKQTSGPATAGSTLAKNLDFSRPYQ